jgi:hypothetical protein
MRAFSKRILLFVSIGVCGVLLAESVHYFRYGHLTRLGLHADVIVEHADIGFEGISKMYGVKLTNYGFLPVSVSACDFIDDDGEHGTSIAYAVEKWSEQSAKWKPIVVWDQSSFCRPYPLGIAQARLFSKRLWPGQSIASGEEATAARDGFELGDNARFVVFTRVAGDMEHAVSTSAFPIDEHRLVNGVPFRVMH